MAMKLHSGSQDSNYRLNFRCNINGDVIQIYSFTNFLHIQYHGAEENMKLADEGNYGFITYKYYGLAAISKNFTDATGQTNIHMSRSEYNLFAGLSWGFRLVQAVICRPRQIKGDITSSQTSKSISRKHSKIFQIFGYGVHFDVPILLVPNSDWATQWGPTRDSKSAFDTNVPWETYKSNTTLY